MKFGNIVKSTGIAMLTIAAATSAANATCTKKSLDGKWSFAIAGGLATVGTMTAGTFVGDFGGSPATFTLTSFSSKTCKGKGLGALGGNSFTLTGATERINTSTAKPNHIFLTMTFGSSVYPVTMQRQ